MLLSLRTLQYIVTAADALSITDAAKHLNVSQPSISAAISQAEQQIGMEIFLRHHAKGISLTVAGRKFVNEARQLLKHAYDFNLSTQSLSHELAGEITVGCFLTLATRFMPGLLADFSKRYPGINVKMEEGNQQELTQGLLAGEIEIAIAYTYALPDEIHSSPLTSLPPYIVVSENHPLAYRDKVSIYEFQYEPLILLDLPLSRDYFLRLFHSCQIEPKIIYRSSSYELIRGLVGHGHGYTIHNAIPGTSYAYDGSRTVVLAIEEALPTADVTCLTLKRHNTRPAVQIFARYVQEQFSQTGIFSPKNLYVSARKM